MSAVVDDTFTDADNTDIESHVGEIGATWTRDTVFGQGNGGGRTFGIFSNKLRRLTFAENSGADGGNSLVRPSGLLPVGVTEFDIIVPVAFVNGGGNATIELYEQAVNPGSGFRLITFGQNIINLNATGAGTDSFGITTAQEYAVKLHVSGTALTLYVDDVPILSGTRAVLPAEPFGLNVFDGGSDGDANLGRFTIESSAPPGPFWTNYVKTTETVA